MYLFQLQLHNNLAVALLHLHSTMYLFQLLIRCLKSTMVSNLHSTMYLFQRKHIVGTAQVFGIYIPLCIYFNAEISVAEATNLHLHSTMYLFQLTCTQYRNRSQLNLHSTMYLFQPAGVFDLTETYYI